jgi:hypothetical protein
MVSGTSLVVAGPPRANSGSTAHPTGEADVGRSPHPAPLLQQGWPTDREDPAWYEAQDLARTADRATLKNALIKHTGSSTGPSSPHPRQARTGLLRSTESRVLRRYGPSQSRTSPPASPTASSARSVSHSATSTPTSSPHGPTACNTRRSRDAAYQRPLNLNLAQRR